MLRFLKQINSERGQALLMVLVLLILAGLMITPTLGHAANTMISIRTIEKNVNGLYAAEAGVKYGLWHLEEGTYTLTENINQMEVTVQVERVGPLVLYFGELMRGDQHSNWLIVDTEIIWVEETTYKYTISVGWQAEPGAPEIRLEEVGGKLPLGYIYMEGSAVVDGNLADRDPIPPEELFEDAGGACMLNWKLQPPLPFVSEDNPVRSQTFYITGEGDIEDYYAWVLANRSDIGETSEIAGTLYTITATAIYPESGEPTCIIVCDVLEQDSTKNIISWQVTK